MNTIQTSIALIILTLSVSPFSLQGAGLVKTNEDSSKAVTLSVDADLVSRYIWRGCPLSLSPNIQPSFNLGVKNFTVGAWGSYALQGQFSEVDLNMTYTAGSFTFSVWDYYNEDESNLSLNNYFDFKGTDSTFTPHSVEGIIQFNGTDNFPLSLTVGTFLLGNDKNDKSKNQFSTYLELGYEKEIGENTLSFFVGGTVAKGFYASEAALVNMGVSASREIKFTETACFPVSASFIVNPNAKNVFLVFGLTL